MVSTFLVSTAVTGVLLLGVAVFLRRLRQWRDDKPGDDASGFDAFAAFVRSERVWMVGYVLLMLVGAAATYGVIAGTAVVPESLANASLLVLGGVFGAALMVFVAFSTYTAVRGSGRPSAQAAGVSAFAVGLVLLVAVSAFLLTA